MNPEILKAIDSIGARLKAADDRNIELLDRIEELEARAKAPGRADAPRTTEYERKHVELFRGLLRNPRDAGAINALKTFEDQQLERKDVSIGTPAAGGFAVPEVIAREVERLERLYSPVRNLVKVVEVGTSDYKELVSLGGATSGWVGETGTRTGTATPQLRERAPTHGELYALPSASNWSLQDTFFSVEDWLAQEIATAFAIEEGDAVIRGNGSNKPTGMLNTTPVTTTDFASPLRAAGAYEFLPSLSVSSPAVAEITGDALIDLVFAVTAQYRVGASWTMNSTTAAAVRKLKDSEGRYFWQPSLSENMPDRLLGFPVAIWEQMDNIGSNAFPIAFGNFRRGYVMTHRGGTRLIVDQVTTPGSTRFYFSRRVGGTVLNNDAVKWLRTTLS